jgi:hypothetical protein
MAIDGGLLQRVNVVVQKELFPRCVLDNRETLHFHNWEFSGFFPEAVSLELLGNIFAQDAKTGQCFIQRVKTESYCLGWEPDALFRQLDVVLMCGIGLLIDAAKEGLNSARGMVESGHGE